MCVSYELCKWREHHNVGQVWGVMPRLCGAAAARLADPAPLLLHHGQITFNYLWEKCWRKDRERGEREKKHDRDN